MQRLVFRFPLIIGGFDGGDPSCIFLGLAVANKCLKQIALAERAICSTHTALLHRIKQLHNSHRRLPLRYQCKGLLTLHLLEGTQNDSFVQTVKIAGGLIQQRCLV